MTKEDAVRNFKTEILPFLYEKYGKNDKIAIRCAWLDYVDCLQKDEQITEIQADVWPNPFS